MQNWWNPGISLENILSIFSDQLSNPNLNDLSCCSEIVALLIKENPEEFRAKANEWTRLYAMEDSSSDTEVLPLQENFGAFNISDCPMAPNVKDLDEWTIYRYFQRHPKEKVKAGNKYSHLW